MILWNVNSTSITRLIKSLLALYHMMLATAGFITLLCADHDHGIIVVSRDTIHETLCADSIITTHHTNRMQLDNLFRDAQQLRHKSKWLRTKIHIEARSHDTQATICKLLHHMHDLRIKKLNLVNCDNGGRCFKAFHNLRRLWQRNRLDILTVMAGDTLQAVAIIQVGFKNLDMLLGNNGPPHPPNEFFCFARKHTAANNFDTSHTVFH